VLATVALDADAGAIADAARIQGRIVSAADDEIDAARDAATAALAHPLLARARAADEALRETPVMHRAEDGSILEGVVDLAFLEKGTWTVVDFKTDVEIASRKDAYVRQVDAYARAITAATGQPATGALLTV
jgi:ATP-dependent helicase/nuclease subunit A